jgi:hypothetical protein
MLDGQGVDERIILNVSSENAIGVLKKFELAQYRDGWKAHDDEKMNLLVS